MIVPKLCIAQKCTKGVDAKLNDDTLSSRTQVFALQCLTNVVHLIVQADENVNGMLNETLQERTDDLIRITFTASTSRSRELKLSGLFLLHDILRHFSKFSDPIFPEAKLLEQYQAQINSAVTPAFAIDSSPEVAAEALSICAEFTCSGVVRDTKSLSRIIKILTASLETCAAYTGKGEFKVGQLSATSENAVVLLKLAILSAWAKLQIYGKEQEFLSAIVSGHVEILAPLWLKALKDFAKIRFGPEDDGAFVLSQDSFVSANRDVLIKVIKAC